MLKKTTEEIKNDFYNVPFKVNFPSIKLFTLKVYYLLFLAKKLFPVK